MSEKQKQALPVFPLNTVVFPGGQLSLRIFEPRYIDMISYCGRESIGFVVVAIKEGREAGEPAIPYNLGTEVRIDDWDQDQNGLLLINCSGIAKTFLVDTWLQEDGLRFAHTQRIALEPEQPVPAQSFPLWNVLAQIGIEPESLSQRNTAWLSARLAEKLPLSLVLKQELLAMNEPADRLAVIQRYLTASMKA